VNIAFFTESYKPYISGVTVSIENLYNQLKKLGHSVYVFAPSYPEDKGSDPNIFRFSSLGTKRYPRFRLAIPYSKNIISDISSLKLDIIHSHSPFQLGVMSQSIAKKLNLPFVYTFHTIFSDYLHYVPFIPCAISKPMLNTWLNNFCNKANAVVVPTNQIKTMLIRQGIKSRIETIPSGLDYDQIDSAKPFALKEKYSISPDKKVLLYVGRLSKEKNLIFLFDSFKLIYSSNPNVHFILTGGGPKEKEYKKLVSKMNLSENITFTGQIGRNEIFRFYKAADIFVFSSKTETQGLVIGEAKAAGLPAVGVAASGTSEMIIDNVDGFLTSESTEVFSNSVLRILSDADLAENMSAKAREDARNRLSIQACAQNMIMLYRSLLATK